MIDLYTWSTPNGRKVSIMLEEVGLPYTVHAVDISKDEQFKPEFLKISPNNRIPAIVDRDNDLPLFESGAILMYLAEKTGQLMPKNERARWHTVQWLMWQMGGIGPMLGQIHHFLRAAKGKAPYADERYVKEGKRLYGVLDRQLQRSEYLAGAYSIADIATWPWISRFEWQTIDMNEFPNVLRWYKAIAARPAVETRLSCPGQAAGHSDALIARRFNFRRRQQDRTRGDAHEGQREFFRSDCTRRHAMGRGWRAGPRPLRGALRVAARGRMHGAGAVRHDERGQFARAR